MSDGIKIRDIYDVCWLITVTVGSVLIILSWVVFGSTDKNLASVISVIGAGLCFVGYLIARHDRLKREKQSNEDVTP